MADNGSRNSPPEMPAPMVPSQLRTSAALAILPIMAVTDPFSRGDGQMRTETLRRLCKEQKLASRRRQQKRRWPAGN